MENERITSFSNLREDDPILPGIAVETSSVVSFEVRSYYFFFFVSLIIVIFSRMIFQRLIQILMENLLSYVLA
jgi:hypothetical protein